MTLIIELSAEEEARLGAASRRHGTDPATFAKRLVTEHPGASEPITSLEAMLHKIARPLPVIPAARQTR